MPILLRTTQNMFNFPRISRNGRNEAYGRNGRSRERTSAVFTFQSVTVGSNIVLRLLYELTAVSFI